MEFNLEVTDVDISAKGEVIEPRDQIALIDADTVLYGTCCTFEEETELLNEDFYTKEEWEDIKADPGFYTDEEGLNYILTINLEEAYKNAQEKVIGILDATGCSDYELHFTMGRDAFLYKLVDNEYKANRTGRGPFGLGDLKKMFAERQPDKAFIWREWEADHIVVCKKLREPEKYLVCAVDKDVLYGVEGEAFNYYTSQKYDIDMKFINVTKDEAMKHFYFQAIMGDAGDGVIGLKGLGKVKAAKYLADCKTEEECWDAVCMAYDTVKVLKNGKVATIVDAITNMRLVSMDQLQYNETEEKWEVKLWKPEF